MKLQLGKISTKELAKWFGIGYDTFRHKKQEKLNELKEYCLFEIVYGGIIVKDIYIEEYVNPNQSNYKTVESHVDEEWDPSGYDTKLNVAKKIYSKHKDELTIQQSTTYDYVRKAANILYGPANDYNTSGTIGNCWYRLCIVDDQGNRRPLTEEEQKRRSDIRKKYCSDKERAKREDIEDSIELKFKNGQITKETRNELRDQLNAWRWQYLQEFEQTLAKNEVLSYATYKYNFETGVEEEISAF